MHSSDDWQPSEQTDDLSRDTGASTEHNQKRQDPPADITLKKFEDLGFKDQVTQTQARRKEPSGILEEDGNHPIADAEAVGVVVPLTQLQIERIRQLETENMRKRRFLHSVIAVAVIVVLSTAAVGGLCGTGLCAPRKKIRSVRSSDWVSLVKNITRSGSNLTYPSPPNATLIDKTLAWLVDENRDTPEERAPQRYALVLLAHSFEIQNWLNGGFEDCELHGVTCDSEGKVTQIALPGEELSGQIPPDISLLSGLTSLALSGNSLAGTVPWSAMMANIPNMNFLDLDRNELTGSFPFPIPGSWQGLEYLWLEENSFSGTLPSALVHWQSLLEFYLRDNILTGTIPSEIGNLTKMEWFAVDINGLHGSLPSTLGRWTNLVRLDVEENIALSGTIPTDFGRWTKLRHFWAFRNNFSGTLPTEISLWTDTIAFITDFNKFVGTIPSEIASWTDIEGFRVNNNNIEGSLPQGVSRWTNLEVFRVDNNPMVTGTIPLGAANWTKIRRAEFHNTRLEGDMPLCVTGSNTSAILRATCDFVQCLCCTDCLGVGSTGQPTLTPNTTPSPSPPKTLSPSTLATLYPSPQTSHLTPTTFALFPTFQLSLVHLPP